MRYNEQQIELESSWIAPCEPHLIGNRRNGLFLTSTGLRRTQPEKSARRPTATKNAPRLYGRTNPSAGSVAPFRDILADSPKLIFAQRQQSTFAIVSQTSSLRIN
ncbi:hypothetical protein [Mesorhizobium sp.]|uniref:hypothetical protein n=1 Tax=Mesorhizobium sp. TaxID=1871066 RepID=UPI000FE8F38E|nr:hypothetical protein [Mesorhizobium sp.]RWP26096.1 MAG: hypothetical protein EOR03_32825 [Mesorhizobium sp.]